MFSALLSSLGLALPAGLNAWLPLLVLALADRFTSQVGLQDPFSFISSTPGLILILLLLPIELIADKIPRIDHVSDLAHTAIRPVCGAIVAAAVADASQDLNAWLASLIGLVAAGTVHAAKTRTRPAITASTAGVGNPIASMIEDAAAVISSIVAVFFPMLVIVITPLAGLGLLSIWRRLRKGSARLRAVAGQSQ